jgi:hypothetical protein
VAAVAVAAVLALLLNASQAQFEAMKPGPEHKVLDQLTGTWAAKIKMWLEPGKDPMTSEGKVTRKWIMNGLFLEEHYTGTFGGKEFQGLGLLGYDPGKKKYVGTWIDSMGPSMMFIEGTYDEKTKTMTTLSDEIDPQGKKSKFRSVLKMESPDHHLHEMFSTPEGGKEMKMMEIHYTKEDTKGNRVKQ